MEKEKEENRKRSKITRVLAIVVIILLLLALTVCLIIIFTHRHAMTYYSAAEATCTTDGNAEYWYCAGCNSYFEDENGNNKIERDDVLVSAKGHSWVGESCEAPRHCSVCNYVDGEPLGHDFSEYIFDGNAACTSDGTETATCTRCDATHTQISYGSAIGHDYVESVVAATCTSSGSVSLICSVCGDSEVATIPATGEHSWDFENGEVTPATGTTEGKIVYGCTVCSETIEVAFPATGEHSWQFDKGEIKSIATCTTEGEIVYGCADCSEVLIIKIPVNTAAHSYDAGVVIKPSCTNDGEVLFTCEHCGVELSAEISATGHSWISATCTSARECATCGAVSGSALGHSWGEYVIYEDIHLRECGHSGCNAVEYAEHTYDDQSLCVCGAQRGTEINIITSIRSWYPGAGPYYTQSIYNSGISSGDIQIPVSAIQGVNSFLAQSFSEVDFMIKSEALDNDVQLNLSVFGEHEEDGSPVDFYATFINGDVSIEYHPMRYFIAFYDLELDAFVPVKFCEGCDRCSDHDHSDDPLSLYDPAYSYTDAFKCNACENCYTRTIDELYEILRSEDSPLNIQFAAGEDIDLTFRIGWNWAYCINEPGYPIESNPEVFEIRSEQGNKYYFTNGYWVTEPTNVDNMDTLFGVEDPVTEGNNTEYFDTMGQKWSASFEEGDFQRDVIDVLYNISFSPIK